MASSGSPLFGNIATAGDADLEHDEQAAHDAHAAIPAAPDSPVGPADPRVHDISTPAAGRHPPAEWEKMMQKVAGLTKLLDNVLLENEAMKFKIKKLEESVAPGADPWQPSLATATPGAAASAAPKAAPTGPPGFPGTAPPEPQPLKEPHFKAVERPERYDGNAEGWTEWSRTFRRFLRLRELLWVALLDAVEALRGKPVTELNEKELDKAFCRRGIYRYKE